MVSKSWHIHNHLMVGGLFYRNNPEILGDILIQFHAADLLWTSWIQIIVEGQFLHHWLFEKKRSTLPHQKKTKNKKKQKVQDFHIPKDVLVTILCGYVHPWWRIHIQFARVNAYYDKARYNSLIARESIKRWNITRQLSDSNQSCACIMRYRGKWENVPKW